jgi:hypothetical protein
MSSSRLSQAKHKGKTQNPVSSIGKKKKIFPNQISIYIGLCHNQDIFQFLYKISKKLAIFLIKKNIKISLIYTREIQ